MACGKTFFLLVVLIWFGIASFARATTQELTKPSELKDDVAVTQMLERMLKGKKYPGAIAAIAKQGEAIRIGATGVRKFGKDVKITTGDMIHLGSCTKAMTASVVARFVERKLVSWNTTLEQAWPEVADKVHADWRKITFAQLLMHRSGLPANTNYHKFKKDEIRLQRKKLAIMAMQKEPVHQPGTNYEYSNLGYMVAGGMLESTTGKSWEELMREEIFCPLKMPTAGFGVVGEKGKIDQPWGHVRSIFGKPSPIQTDNGASLGPAGTVKLTMPDWAKFVLAHCDGGDQKFLSSESREKLHTIGLKKNYAMGWIVIDQPWAGGDALHHGGTNTTWYALVWASPKNNTAYLVAMNCFSSKTPAMAQKIFEELLELNKPVGY